MLFRKSKIRFFFQTDKKNGGRLLPKRVGRQSCGPGPQCAAGLAVRRGTDTKKRGFPQENLSDWKLGNYSLLNYLHVYGLLALGAVADFEFDVLTFVERLETIR